MFDPAQPAQGSPLQSAVMRSQFTSLKALIDAISAITQAQVDGVTTLNPGEPAAASVTITGSTLSFTFDIPQGQTGAPGGDGPIGPPGPPGEVTTAQLAAEMATTALNPTAVSPMNITFSDPPTQGELVQVQDKFNELLTALYRSV